MKATQVWKARERKLQVKLDFGVAIFTRFSSIFVRQRSTAFPFESYYEKLDIRNLPDLVMIISVPSS